MNTMMLYVSGASTQPPWQLIGIGLLVVILACPLGWILSVIWPKPGEAPDEVGTGSETPSEIERGAVSDCINIIKWPLGLLAAALGLIAIAALLK